MEYYRHMIKIKPFVPANRPKALNLLAVLQDHVAQVDPLHRLRRKEEFDVQRYFVKLRSMLKKEGEIFLAFHEDEVVGLVAAAVHNSTMSDLEVRPGLGHSGRIFELIVDQDARGLGVGKKLLKAAEQFLRSKKCGIIFIGCFATNTVALDFYRRNGYVERNIEFAKKVRQ